MAAELEKTPTADSAVNKPASGTYGEKAIVEKLKSQLPASPGGPGGPPTGPPPMGAPQIAGPSGNMGGRPMSAPGSVPGALMHPTQRPGVPLGQPLAQQPQSPMAGAQKPNEARMIVLRALSEDPEVSPRTREWAKMVIELVNRGSGPI